MKTVWKVCCLVTCFCLTSGFNIASQGGMKTIKPPLGSSDNPAFFGYQLTLTGGSEPPPSTRGPQSGSSGPQSGSSGAQSGSGGAQSGSGGAQSGSSGSSKPAPARYEFLNFYYVSKIFLHFISRSGVS